LLENVGVETVVLENRSREYVEHRQRAGLLEQGSVDLLTKAGVAERLHREGLIHTGLSIQFDGERHRIPLTELSGGKHVTIYAQTEIVKDLVAARIESGLPLLFEAEAFALEGLDSERPRIRYRQGGGEHELECDLVAGCDGFHGISRPSIPERLVQTFSREYPYAWLGIIAQAPPSNDELIYAHSPRGFALLSMRSPTVGRLYLQCRPDEQLDEWPDERIWRELHARLGLEGWTLEEGPITEKGITPMRSFVTEPLSFGRLYLAGDAGHIVPPTGAKGLNLAINDVRLLGEAIVRFAESGDRTLLDAYSQACLRRVWRAEHFSWWMTTMLHKPPGADPFDEQLQLSQLRYVASSEAAARTLAENYVGYEATTR
jgi:p-hydroxybenzoate 3-monooxygenase